eukprot:CAMPEP_0172451820 /NCGR_PEP_ID=MMETSP1065-20121228/9691_1 /TAXON_ID=265537 /ORGANISM="Amphiprora paludosa, Strain CCMP125" /LENGTH=668 /DNA_ID=CAMNT_0013203791 /DNA_START=39 /DNA_END=2045 /DNA_ORIENTATION=-
MTMTVSPAFAIVAAALLTRPTGAQDVCPSDASTTGYSTISALNSAMEAELALIESGSTPQDSYEFILCPNTVFDTAAGPLRPILDAASFLCGANGTSVNACTFEGGDQQVFIEDSQVATYPLETMLFAGITFRGFTENVFQTGTSISALATSTTTATFDDVIWTDFIAQSAVRQVSAATSNPMTVDIQNSAIVGGDATDSVFINDGGVLTVSGLNVEGLTAVNFITTTNRGSSTLSDSVISQSGIERVTETLTRGVQRVEGVNITNMNSMVSTFDALDSGTSLIVADTLVENNFITDPWQVVDVQAGAVGQIEGSSVSTNSGMQFGIIARGAQSVVSVEDSFLANNVGLGPNVTCSPLFALQNAVLAVERTEINNNREYSGQALALFGSTMSISRSCFQDTASSFVAFVDNAGTFTTSENFISGSQSSFCPAPGNRLFVEATGSGCFTGGVCEGSCDVLADQASCLAGIPPPTVSPTLVPTFLPTVSSRPSATPTVPPTNFPTTSKIPTRTPTLPPTSLSPTRQGDQPTLQPTCPEDKGKGGPIKPSMSQKMKLAPTSRSKLRPAMKMTKVEHSTYYDNWVNAEYLQASEASIGRKYADIQAASESSNDYLHEATCAPVRSPTRQPSSSGGKGKGVPPPITILGKKSMMSTKKKSSKSISKGTSKKTR